MKIKTIFILLFVVLAYRCGGDGSGTLTLRMTDAPITLTTGEIISSININIKKINIEIESSSNKQEINVADYGNSGKFFDLLELTNGVTTKIGTIQVPAGKCVEISVKLGNNHTIVVNNTTYQLIIPLPEVEVEFGNKEITITDGSVKDVIIDFQAATTNAINSGVITCNSVSKTCTLNPKIIMKESSGS